MPTSGTDEPDDEERPDPSSDADADDLVDDEPTGQWPGTGSPSPERRGSHREGRRTSSTAVPVDELLSSTPTDESSSRGRRRSPLSRSQSGDSAPEDSAPDVTDDPQDVTAPGAESSGAESRSADSRSAARQQAAEERRKAAAKAREEAAARRHAAREAARAARTKGRARTADDVATGADHQRVEADRHAAQGVAVGQAAADATVGDAPPLPAVNANDETRGEDSDAPDADELLGDHPAAPQQAVWAETMRERMARQFAEKSSHADPDAPIDPEPAEPDPAAATPVEPEPVRAEDDAAPSDPPLTEVGDSDVSTAFADTLATAKASAQSRVAAAKAEAARLVQQAASERHASAERIASEQLAEREAAQEQLAEAARVAQARLDAVQRDADAAVERAAAERKDLLAQINEAERRADERVAEVRAEHERHVEAVAAERASEAERIAASEAAATERETVGDERARQVAEEQQRVRGEADEIRATRLAEAEQAAAQRIAEGEGEAARIQFAAEAHAERIRHEADEEAQRRISDAETQARTTAALRIREAEQTALEWVTAVEAEVERATAERILHEQGGSSDAQQQQQQQSQSNQALSDTEPSWRPATRNTNVVTAGEVVAQEERQERADVTPEPVTSVPTSASASSSARDSGRTPVPEPPKVRRKSTVVRVRTVAAMLVSGLGLFAAVVLAVGVLLLAIGANGGNGLVEAMTGLADTLVGPFRDLYTATGSDAEDTSRLVNWGIAAIVYLLLSRFVSARLHP